MVTGSLTALITPFREGRVDEEAFQALIAWQIEQGSHGLVPCGTTGESPTLSEAEHARVTEFAVAAAGGRVPVIAGCGTNSTETSIVRLRHAEAAGADAALVVVPYYNKPSQEGLYAHFAALHEAARLPIIIYNIPGRTGADMSVETMARLAALEQIKGVKDATRDLARVGRQRAACGEGFLQLSGEDPTAVGFNAMGGVGCISVTANVAPAACARMQQATLDGDYATALELQDRLFALHEALFCEPSPAPVKYAASLLGLCNPELRGPLVPLSDAGKMRVSAAMAAAGLHGAAQSA